MANGLDTTFLVCAEVSEHPGHATARALLLELMDQGQPMGLAPQVLAEFIHVVTDPRRFARPLESQQAITRARHWWEAKEVTQVYPSEESTNLFLRWMADHRLGRKRLLDTQLAATYLASGLSTIVTTNPRDFRLFEGLTVREP